MKVKKLIHWFRIFLQWKNNKKGKIWIVYSKSAWKDHWGQPCSLASTCLRLKYFHFYLSDAAPVFPKLYHLQFPGTFTWPLPIHIRIAENCQCHWPMGYPEGASENLLEWAEPVPLSTSWSLDLWMWSLYFDSLCGSVGLPVRQQQKSVT